MLKFKIIFIVWIIYFIIISFYLFLISSSIITLEIFYNNIIFMIIYLIIANLFIDFDKLLDIKLYRYRNKMCFFKECLKNFTLNIFICLLGISMINGLMFYIIDKPFNKYLSVYYFTNWFFGIEIIYICMLAFSFKRKINFIRSLSFIGLCCMFIFGRYDIGITPINVFKYILYIGNFSSIITHYIVWLLGCYLLIDYNIRRVEI